MSSQYKKDIQFSKDITRVAKAFIKKKFKGKYDLQYKQRTGFAKKHFYEFHRTTTYSWFDCVFKNEVDSGSDFDLCTDNSKIGYISYFKDMKFFYYFNYNIVEWIEVNLDDYLDTTIEENHFMVSLTESEQLLTIITVYYYIKNKFKSNFYLNLDYLEEMIKYLDKQNDN